jgi:predicted PurR-regulated permease PerM
MKKITVNSQLAFLVVLILLGLTSLYIVQGYISLFILALIFVIIFHPLYQFLLAKLKKPAFASIASTAIILSLVIIPLIIITTIAVNQAISLIHTIDTQIKSNDPATKASLAQLQEYLSSANGLVNQYVPVGTVNVNSIIQDAIGNVSRVLTVGIIPIITGIFNSIIQFLILILFMLYLFPARATMMAGLKDISPVDSHIHTRFIERFEAVTIGTVKGTFLVGLAQGFLGGLILAILGYQSALFWGLIIGLAAFVPGGANLIWIPINIFFLLSGNYAVAAIFFTWNILLTSTVDNVIRARVLKSGAAGMPELLTLIAVLGGIDVFGFWGFIYGPVILAIFFTALQVYGEEKLTT